MKTDVQLHRDVLSELVFDPRVTEKEIAIAAHDGVVTLAGSVSSYAEKWAAEQAAARVAGVAAIANELMVNLDGRLPYTDTDIAHHILETLAWDMEVPRDAVTVKVVSGWVTLEGEVKWKYQRDAVAGAIRYLQGIRGITNSLVVRGPRTSPLEVAEHIKAALERRADRTAERVAVEVHDGVVTLSGQVASYAERRAAEGAAWSAPGVTEVRDQLAVVM